MTNPVLGGADARGQDFAGCEFSFASLQQARFDGANLRGAVFRQVDLTNASFRGACLDGAQFTLVRAGAADFQEIRGEGALWERSSLVAADFSRSDLRRATLRACGLERARFAEADLSLATLAWSSLDGATLHKTNLDHAETLGIDLYNTDLSSARNFAYCREMVVELLRRQIGDDVEMNRWLGFIHFRRLWCYPALADLFREQPAYRDLALDLFSRHPDSGCLEAFSTALRGKAPAF